MSGKMVTLPKLNKPPSDNGEPISPRCPFCLKQKPGFTISTINAQPFVVVFTYCTTCGGILSAVPIQMPAPQQSKIVPLSSLITN